MRAFVSNIGNYWRNSEKHEISHVLIANLEIFKKCCNEVDRLFETAIEFSERV
jgi:hypothetical protein